MLTLKSRRRVASLLIGVAGFFGVGVASTGCSMCIPHRVHFNESFVVYDAWGKPWYTEFRSGWRWEYGGPRCPK
jgi:hypothetical protein